MSHKIKIKNYHVYWGVLVFVLVLGAAILYFYKINAATKENHTVAEAVAIFGNGNPKEAISILESIVKEDPSNKDAVIRLSMYYYQDKDFDKLLNFASTNDVQDVTVYNMLADVYQSRGDSANAEKYFRAAISLSPKNIQSYVNFAAYYQARTNYESALAILRDGLEIAPNSATLLNSAASVCLKMGDKAEAADYVDRVLKNEPENTQARAIKERTK